MKATTLIELGTQMAKDKAIKVYEVKGKTKAGDDVLVCRINRATKRGRYYLKPDVPQSDYVSSIDLIGFTALPAGLKRSGAGLTSSNGYLILKDLSDTLGSFTLAINKLTPTKISKAGRTYNLILNHDDFRSVQSTLAKIGKEKFEEQKSSVRSHLNKLFPKQFRIGTTDPMLYRPGDIAAVLAKTNIIDRLSPKDMDQLSKFFPSFLRAAGSSAVDVKKLLALSKSKRAVEIVYLDRVIKQFESRLKKPTLSESSWQEFLREYILIFNSNYARSLEKESVSVHGRYPDFILLDAYNFLDIYEIKKPSTPLLKRDESHNNYYWDAEIVKAISQAENYLAHAERIAPALSEDFKVRKGIDVRVLKPRGFIIAGQRSQLTNEDMERSFRLMNNSLRNVQVILYDDLLQNLRNFVTRIRKAPARRRAKRTK